MPDAKETLKEWCSSGKLSEASLSSDGATLTLGDVSLPGKENVTVSSADGKEAQYTLGSIFLQILDPDQSLPKYRMACKKHSVTDPVKALDKPTIVGFFLSSSSSSSAAPPAAAAAAPVEAAPEAEKPAAAADSAKAPDHRKDKDPDRKRSSSSSKHHHDKHRRDKKRPPSHHKDKHRDKHAKKHRSMVTNEQLFSNLNVVVDKRGKQPGATGAPGGDDSKSKETTSPDLVEEPRNEEFEAIRKALSPEGFQVTPEMLEKHKEITETLMAHEIPVGDSASVLRASSVGANLSRVLNLFVDTVNPSKGKGKGSAQSPVKKSSRPYLIGKKPIILLPKGMTAPITMVNGYEFFANSRFYPRDMVMKTKSLQTHMKTTKFSRKMPGVGQIEYELLDNPRKLQTKEEWERVVAVVVLGHKWQFKDWPGKYSDPVQLFAKVFGFYVGIEGDTLPTDLVGWAVSRSKLHRDKRGLDSVTHASFWNSLDEWIKIHKPELVPHGME